MKLPSIDRDSLSFKLAFWLATSSLGLVVLVAIINTRFVQSYYLMMEEDKISTIMKDALKTLGINLSYEFHKAIEETGRDLLANRDIMKVEIENGSTGRHYTFTAPGYSREQDFFTKTMDIPDPATGKSTGRLRLTWSRQGYNHVMSLYYQKLMVVIAIYMVCILVLIRFMVRRLAPLKKLAKQMNSYSPQGGAINIDFEPGGSDEVSLIGQAASTMSRNIQDYSMRLETLNRELRKSHDELELRVQERTRELKEKQAQLAHAGRLVALGELAAGIAHELGQPLQIIKSAAGIISEELRGGELTPKDVVPIADKITRQIDRAFSIINNMRTFARHDSNRPVEAIDIKKPLLECLTFFNTQFRHHGIDITLEIDDNLPKIRTDYQKFQQIIANLLSNARHAIESRTDRETRGEIVIRLFNDDPSRQVVLQVQDNGIGMTPQERERCLEPFFTTKDPDQGTGLGLSIVYGLLKEFGFTIEVESMPGRGSTFTVRMKREDDT